LYTGKTSDRNNCNHGSNQFEFHFLIPSDLSLFTAASKQT